MAVDNQPEISFLIPQGTLHGNQFLLFLSAEQLLDARG